MKQPTERFKASEYLLFGFATLLVVLLCVCVGNVNIPLGETLRTFSAALRGLPLPQSANSSILLSVRLPRVLCVALVGGSLSLCGAAMQGLLRNPLADGSTLGVSSGASLGAVISIGFGITIPGIPFAGTMTMAMLFAFASLAIILSLSYKIDYSLSTNTIILIGVVYSMFANSLMSVVITFAGEKVKSIAFWTMGTLAQSSYLNALVLLLALLLFGGVLLAHSRELNAFAIGEDNARHIGVNVRRVKLLVMLCVSCLIGVCVSVGGSIGFVGLVTPHVTRLLIGPNHKRLMPASLFSGAMFLLLSDLVARTLLRPLELPIGVVTSLIGSAVFVYIFTTSRRAK